MSETAGGCAIVAQNSMINPYSFAPNPKAPSIEDGVRDAYRMRRIAKQEIRRQELEAKEKSGEITDKEAMELAAIKQEETLEKIAHAFAPKICYVA